MVDLLKLLQQCCEVTVLQPIALGRAIERDVGHTIGDVKQGRAAVVQAVHRSTLSCGEVSRWVVSVCHGQINLILGK